MLSPGRKKAEKQEPPVQELTRRLDHLENTILEAREAYVENLRNPHDSADDSSSKKAPSSGGIGRFFRRQSITPQKDKKPSTPPLTTNSDDSDVDSSNTRKDDPVAKFIDIPDSDTFVENLRRVAELVVVGENFVTNLQKQEEAAFKRDQEKWKSKRDDWNIGTTESDETNEDTLEDVEHKDEYMQLFDLFFERNGLEMIINLITGATFRLTDEEKKEIGEALDTSEENKESDDTPPVDTGDGEGGGAEDEDLGLITPTKMAQKRPDLDKAVLPPFQVGTQALQSISILVQNVSRVTSLYVVLSNNLINELINLPLGLYLAAERHRQLDSGMEAQPMTFQSPQISEMTTHFVTFLKSLALRMNVQTLQFYLKYPTEVAGGGAGSSSHFCSGEDGAAETVEDEEEAILSKRLSVDFPLYDRALEFCGAHQDSFVRLTALNICLNTLRLTTVSPPDEAPEEETACKELGSSPDGVLHNSKPLPYRERLAIAHHTCIPSRVERLISPIFTKLAERWNSLDEKLREIDSNKGSGGGEDFAPMGVSRNEKFAQAKEKARVEKLIRSFNERASNIQDELLILEDVFQVGLTVLNEQMVEMMLATFVYPLLLQPLLLYSQRLSAALDVPVFSLSEHPLGGNSGDYSEVEKSLAPVAGPAKAALFSLASVFHLLTNQPLLRLIVTALLHPLSPDSSGVPTLRSQLEVSTVTDNGRNAIRLDKPTQYLGPDGGRTTYAFGTTPGNRRVSRAKVDLSVLESGGEACVFVLSPALAEVLEFRGEDESLIARTRPNQYRRALLQYLDAPSELSDVQGLAFHVLDAVVTALDGKFVADVVFGADLMSFSDDMPADERNIDSEIAHTTDDRGIGGGAAHQSRQSLDRQKDSPVGSDLTAQVIPSLCRCVLTSSKQPARGVEWRLNFDEVAAHLLLCSVRYNDRAMKIAASTTENLWQKAATFVSGMPSKIPPPAMGGSSIPMQGSPSLNDPDYDGQIEGSLMNFIFYDAMEASDDTPVAESFLKLQEKQEDDEGYSVIISSESSFNSLCSRIGGFLLHDNNSNDSDMLSDKDEVKIARNDANALLKLDALVNLLKDMAATGGGLIRESAVGGIAVSSDGTIVDTKNSFVPDISKQIHSPLSSTATKCLMDNQLEKDLPETGSTIDLSGKPLLPCVCEAPASLSHLFTSTSSVVSEGITWQSLFLILSEKYLILAQPQQLAEGSSEGRVITSCLLERLSVEQDGVADDDGPPASRLLLFHKWFDPKPPTFFMFDAMPEYEEYGPFIKAKPFTSTLDVWFEDNSTATHACQILSKQIFAAKSARGHRIQQFLPS